MLSIHRLSTHVPRYGSRTITIFAAPTMHYYKEVKKKLIPVFITFVFILVLAMFLRCDDSGKCTPVYL